MVEFIHHAFLFIIGCMIACYDENPDWAKFLGVGIAVVHVVKLIVLVICGS